MRCKATRNKGTGRLAVSCIFFYKNLKKYLQNLKCNIPKDMYFSFNFAWDSIQLGLLNEKNLLSVTKVICQ